MQGDARLNGIEGRGYVIIGPGPEPEIRGEFVCGGKHTVDLRDSAGQPLEYTGPVARPGRRGTETLWVLTEAPEEYRPTIRVRISGAVAAREE